MPIPAATDVDTIARWHQRTNRRLMALELAASDGTGGSGGGGSVDEVFIGPGDPGGAYELWYDTDAIPPPSTMGLSYVHNQASPAATWVVNHDLGFYPNVIVEDSAGTTVEGDVAFDNTNRLTLTFSAAFAGIAYLS